MAFQQSSDTESSSSHVNIMDSYSDSLSPSLVDSDADSQDSVDIMTCHSAAEANSYTAEESLHAFERKRERQWRYRENRDKLRELGAQERSQLIAKLKSFVYSNTDNLNVNSEAITEELITRSLDVSSLKEIKNMLSERQKRAEKRKKYQQRYRERHRELLRQRAMERRRQLRSDDDSSRQNSAMSVEDPMGILIEVPKVSEKSLSLMEKMEKKRERQRRYREKHREILRLREMERRRLMRTVSDSRRKSKKNSGAKKKETDDEMITNSVRSVGEEGSGIIEIEIPRRSEEETILPHFLEQEPVSPVQSRRRKERSKQTRKRQLDHRAQLGGMNRNAFSEQGCINESVETNANAHVLDKFETTQEYFNDNFENGEFGHTSAVCDGIVLKRSPATPVHAQILDINHPEEVNIKVEKIEYDDTPDARSIDEDDLYTGPIAPYKTEIAELGPLDNYAELEIGPELGPAENHSERELVYIKTEIDPEEAPDLHDFKEMASEDWSGDVGAAVSVKMEHGEVAGSFQRHELIRTYARGKN